MFAIHRRRMWDVDGTCSPEWAFLSRRKFLQAIGVGSLGVVGACADEQSDTAGVSDTAAINDQLRASLRPNSGNVFVKGGRNSNYRLDRAITDETIAGSYNNFYEFTTAKEGVWRLAQKLTTRPWTVEVTGEVARPMTLDVDDIIRKMVIEERIYRFRCVEAWAMAVPWMGFGFKAFLDWIEPTSRAKYVRLVTFHRPGEAVAQSAEGGGNSWRWPYYEGLAIEEAANELTFMANGLYGHELPKQHGAPLRLVVPWKYGYKSIKSIVRIELTERQPATFWNDAVPHEYDFWSNVNPKRPHPRWSQATERLIGTGERRPTLPYNGYAEFVHHLYKGKPRAAL